MRKADGSEMNAISWTIGQIAGHWLIVTSYASDEEPDPALLRFFGPEADPTPPSLSEAIRLLEEANTSVDWLASADDTLLSASHEGHVLGHHGNVGTALMKAVLHTWFHTGEINAVRQMLGHTEIPFVGEMLGSLEWRGVPA